MNVKRKVSRRHAMAGIALGGASAFTTMKLPVAAASDAAKSGTSVLKIRKVRAITTAPNGIRLVVVKVETDEPDLYGLGCATFNQRPLAVVESVNRYLDPFARGRNADNIEDIWQTAYTSSYWRNGPVLNNALSGLDMALWDIKGKRANMPVYQLLGGKSRFAVDLYAHASGRDAKQIEDSVRSWMEKGYRHVRIQLGGIRCFASPPRVQIFGPLDSVRARIPTWIRAHIFEKCQRYSRRCEPLWGTKCSFCTMSTNE